MKKLISSVLSFATSLAMFGFVPSLALADVSNIDFESYSLGTINAQDGWSSTGSAGGGCAVYDHEVDSSLGTAGFGSQSLRMSNAVTSGCFGDQTFSKSLVDEAGETSAMGDGMSGGNRQTHFEAQWDFASTVPGSEQSGLSVVASPDRGDGARMSWVQMADTPTGLDVNFYDYADGLVEPAGTCVTGDNFRFSSVATGLDRTVPHNIKITMDFVDGAGNDVVNVYVDGVLMHTGTSWEDYFRYCESNPTRTVDSVLFRTGGAAAPATAGNGFLIDNLTLTSGAQDTDADDDGVLNDVDLCPNTVADAFPQWNKSKGRYMWDGSAWVASGKGDKNFQPTMDYTYGCSGTQILDAMTEATGQDFGGHYKYGVTKSILEEWHAGRYYLETISVGAADTDGTNSLMALANGQDYLLKASGTAFACNEPGCTIQFDADYSTSDATNWVDGVAAPYDSYGPDLLDLMVNGGFVAWDTDATYNTDHMYWHEYTGDGNPLNATIYDVFYPNNTGDLAVDIYAKLW